MTREKGRGKQGYRATAHREVVDKEARVCEVREAKGRVGVGELLVNDAGGCGARRTERRRAAHTREERSAVGRRAAASEQRGKAVGQEAREREARSSKHSACEAAV